MRRWGWIASDRIGWFGMRLLLRSVTAAASNRTGSGRGHRSAAMGVVARAGVPASARDRDTSLCRSTPMATERRPPASCGHGFDHSVAFDGIFFCPFGGPSLRASHSWRVVRCRESPQARESTTPAMRIRAIRRPARSAATNAPSPRWLRSSPRPLRPAFQTKPRPPSPRRTPYPGGMVQVAHGCATALRKDRMSSRRVGHTARVRRPLPELGLSHRLKGPVWS